MAHFIFLFFFLVGLVLKKKTERLSLFKKQMSFYVVVMWNALYIYVEQNDRSMLVAYSWPCLIVENECCTRASNKPIVQHLSTRADTMHFQMTKEFDLTRTTWTSTSKSHALVHTGGVWCYLFISRCYLLMPHKNWMSLLHLWLKVSVIEKCVVFRMVFYDNEFLVFVNDFRYFSGQIRANALAIEFGQFLVKSELYFFSVNVRRL